MVRVAKYLGWLGLGNMVMFYLFRPHNDINMNVCMCVFVLGNPIVNTFVQAVMGYFLK